MTENFYQRIQLLLGRDIFCKTLLLIFTLSGVAACTEDSPASPEPQNLVETRATADSTAVGDTSAVPTGQLQADTAWAGTDNFQY